MAPVLIQRTGVLFVLIFNWNCSILPDEIGEGKHNQGDIMLTLKAVLKDRRI
jgi:hypothetical protein